MKRITLLSFSLFIIFTSCRKDNDIWRGDFEWKGTIEGTYKQYWKISCDKDCIECIAKDENGDIALSKSKYKSIYDECIGLPDHPPVDPNDTTVNPTGKVRFKSWSSLMYGFDGWPGTIGQDKINYLSIAVNCSTGVLIVVDTVLQKAFDNIVVSLPAIAFNKLSFSKTGYKDTIKLRGGSNFVKIYAAQGTPIATPVDLLVYGKNNGADSSCLAGNCFGSEDRLQVVMYQEKIFTKRYNVYFVGNPNFRPTETAWRSNFNSVLKQAVAKLGDTIALYDLSPYTSEWDYNNNKKIDIIAGSGVFDFYQFDDGELITQDEYELLRIAKNHFGEETERCDEYMNHSTFLNGINARMHWVLTYSYFRNSSDSMKLHLNSVEFLSKGRIYKIAQFSDSLQSSPGHFESVLIKEIYEATNEIALVSPLSKNFSRQDGITIFTDDGIYEAITPQLVTSDFEPSDCSYCMPTSHQYPIIIHEFLHQKSAGFFRHVTNNGSDTANPPAKGNIMHPTDGIGLNLNYRRLTIPIWEQNGGTTYSQWDKMHQ